MCRRDATDRILLPGSNVDWPAVGSSAPDDILPEALDGVAVRDVRQNHEDSLGAGLLEP